MKGRNHLTITKPEREVRSELEQDTKKVIKTAYEGSATAVCDRNDNIYKCT